MAKLQSGDLILEIKFNSFEPDWIAYEVKFSWKDDVIVNDNILKRTGEYWGKRSYGTFLANDYDYDRLIGTIKKVLNTGEADYWEPVEPDIVMAIYPDTYFPFMKSHWAVVYEKDGKQEEIEPEKGKCFTVITFIDSYNFKDSGAYSEKGISLHLVVKRDALENFVTELETEYKNLKLEHNDPVPADMEHGAETIDPLSLDPAITELILFLQKEGPKTDAELVVGIPGFKKDTLGKAGDLGLVESLYPTVWLTSAGQGLATVLNRLLKSL